MAALYNYCLHSPTFPPRGFAKVRMPAGANLNQFIMEEPIKKLALILIVAVLLAGCQAPASPQQASATDPLVGQIAGKYATTITGDDSAIFPDVEKGDYLLKIQSDLRWFITDANDPGWIGVQGYYTITADQIVFKATGGMVVGSCINIQNTYGWKLDGQALALTALNVDSKCEGEKFFFTVHPFARQP